MVMVMTMDDYDDDNNLPPHGHRHCYHNHYFIYNVISINRIPCKNQLLGITIYMSETMCVPGGADQAEEGQA